MPDQCSRIPGSAILKGEEATPLVDALANAKAMVYIAWVETYVNQGETCDSAMSCDYDASKLNFHNK